LIVEKVNLLLKDEKLAEKMGERAYKTVTEKFSWDRITTKFYNLYSKCLQKSIVTKKTVLKKIENIVANKQ